MHTVCTAGTHPHTARAADSMHIDELHRYLDEPAEAAPWLPFAGHSPTSTGPTATWCGWPRPA